MEQLATEQDCLEVEGKREEAACLLGAPGRMLSLDKEDYRREHPAHVVVFNATIFTAAGDRLWWGDLDVSSKLDECQQLAEEVGAFVVAVELPYRFKGLTEEDAAIFQSNYVAEAEATRGQLFLFSPGQADLGHERIEQRVQRLRDLRSD
jgi:hypothetical protein